MMRTLKKETRFMVGNIDVDGVIIEIMEETHGKSAVRESAFSDDTVYSDGFISAIRAGRVPMLELHETTSSRFHNDLDEYHHVIIDGECYNVYFKD